MVAVRFSVRNGSWLLSSMPAILHVLAMKGSLMGILTRDWRAVEHAQQIGVAPACNRMMISAVQSAESVVK